MANLTVSNLTNITSNFSSSLEELEKQNVSNEVNFQLLIAIIFNCITCPFTVLLNALVIMAVKRRTSLQSNANILLACLAVTDALTGLISQPSFALWRTFLLLGIKDPTITDFHKACFLVLSICSCLHVMFVVGERLVAIKFTFYYPYIVTKRNIKLAVIVCWIYSISCGIAREVTDLGNTLLVAPVFFFCVVFVSFSYLILYRETLRHQKMIKAQQLSQEEVKRFLEESKALKTTVLVVSAVVLCLIPSGLSIVLSSFRLVIFSISSESVFRTIVMLNSLLNPMIYCWRQKEMRKLVFRGSTTAVEPVN